MQFKATNSFQIIIIIWTIYNQHQQRLKETHHKQKINSPSIRVEKSVLIKVKRRKINLLVGVVAVIARGGAGGGRKQWTLEGVANRDRQRGRRQWRWGWSPIRLQSGEGSMAHGKHSCTATKHRLWTLLLIPCRLPTPPPSSLHPPLPDRYTYRCRSHWRGTVLLEAPPPLYFVSNLVPANTFLNFLDINFLFCLDFAFTFLGVLVHWS